MGPPTINDWQVPPETDTDGMEPQWIAIDPVQRPGIYLQLILGSPVADPSHSNDGRLERATDLSRIPVRYHPSTTTQKKERLPEIHQNSPVAFPEPFQ